MVFSAKKKERVAMKRRYQIDQQRAVQQFRQLAREENPNIQMMFPMAEVVGLLQEGVGHLLREAGLSGVGDVTTRMRWPDIGYPDVHCTFQCSKNRSTG
jgi:hypothetical protein